MLREGTSLALVESDSTTTVSGLVFLNKSGEAKVCIASAGGMQCDLGRAARLRSSQAIIPGNGLLRTPDSATQLVQLLRTTAIRARAYSFSSAWPWQSCAGIIITSAQQKTWVGSRFRRQKTSSPSLRPARRCRAVCMAVGNPLRQQRLQERRRSNGFIRAISSSSECWQVHAVLLQHRYTLSHVGDSRPCSLH